MTTSGLLENGKSISKIAVEEEQATMPASLVTVIDLTDEELKGIYGGGHDHDRRDDDDHRDDDDRRRRRHDDDRFSFRFFFRH